MSCSPRGRSRASRVELITAAAGLDKMLVRCLVDWGVMPENTLYYGDNLDILRDHVRVEGQCGAGGQQRRGVRRLIGALWQAQLGQATQGG